MCAWYFELAENTWSLPNWHYHAVRNGESDEKVVVAKIATTTRHGAIEGKRTLDYSWWEYEERLLMRPSGQKNRSPKLPETIPQDGEMDEYMHLLWLNGL